MAAIRTCVAEWCLFLCGFLPLYSATDINCTATQFANQTIYSISDVFPVSDVKPPPCMYTWANASNIVLAHNTQEIPKLVVKNCINTLITSKCFDKIVFACHCGSEKKDYTAACTINCTLNALRSQDHKEISHNQIAANDNVAAIILGLVGLVGLVVLGVLCYKFRDKISRKCGQLRGIYTSVNMQNLDPKEDAVEVGNEV